ncbi:MAG: hypothetical protein K9K67_05490 [Bacteriovoracaceae bacterium]|nr:hypothetical protein [Bacteriovoracaceae bacterium]
MTKIFLVESDDLIRHLFEEKFGETVYTLDSSDDLSFRLPDFAPELVIFSANLFLKDSAQESERMSICADIPCALLGFADELEEGRGRGWRGGVLLKPLEIEHLEQTIADLFAQLSKGLNR